MHAAKGAQVYSFITQNCQFVTGLIILADKDQLILLDVGSGRPVEIERSQVRQALVFDLIENPFKEIRIEGVADQELRKVFLDSSQTPTTIGWPVRFIENLVVFFDLEGKTHVYDLEKIVKLRPAKGQYSKTFKPRSFVNYQFDYSQASHGCANIPRQRIVGQQVLRPTRILSDQIKLSNFLDEFEQGFIAVNSFQERTYLYARPFLFDRASRLGFVGGDSSRIEPGTADFGAFFKWSTGRPYGFQSETALGWHSMEHTPLIGPVGGVTSSVKSHFFHGHFAGNLQNIPAGRPVHQFDVNQRQYLIANRPAQFFVNFNYLGLLGGDYGPFSVSFGYFYPTFGIKMGNELREILGSRTTIAVRGMYTSDRWRVHVTGSQIRFGSDSPTQDDLITYRRNPSEFDSYFDVDSPDRFDFSAWFIRAGLDYELSNRFQVSAGGLGFKGDYSDSVQALQNRLAFQRIGIWGRLTQQFSTYTALSVTFVRIEDNLRGNQGATPTNLQQQDNSVYGSFQLLFE